MEADWDRLADARATADQEAAQNAELEAAGRSGRGRRRGQRAEAKPVELPRVREAIQAIRDTVDASDIALFGRMVAENTHMKVDAASQVAHAFSTHACEWETDYFTAVDDRQPDEDPGAGMLGLVGYQSACFYRYALVHRDQLVDNLGGNESQANETILTRPEGRVQPGGAHDIHQQRHVSILTRPEGRVQPWHTPRPRMRRTFQSSPGPKAGCNGTTT